MLLRELLVPSGTLFTPLYAALLPCGATLRARGLALLLVSDLRGALPGCRFRFWRRVFLKRPCSTLFILGGLRRAFSASAIILGVFGPWPQRCASPPAAQRSACAAPSPAPPVPSALPQPALGCVWSPDRLARGFRSSTSCRAFRAQLELQALLDAPIQILLELPQLLLARFGTLALGLGGAGFRGTPGARSLRERLEQRRRPRGRLPPSRQSASALRRASTNAPASRAVWSASSVTEANAKPGDGMPATRMRLINPVDDVVHRPIESRSQGAYHALVALEVRRAGMAWYRTACRRRPTDRCSRLARANRLTASAFAPCSTGRLLGRLLFRKRDITRLVRGDADAKHEKRRRRTERDQRFQHLVPHRGHHLPRGVLMRCATPPFWLQVTTPASQGANLYRIFLKRTIWLHPPVHSISRTSLWDRLGNPILAAMTNCHSFHFDPN